jgi:hypothetical protein
MMTFLRPSLAAALALRGVIFSWALKMTSPLSASTTSWFGFWPRHASAA